jgi:hypothetical protein
MLMQKSKADTWLADEAASPELMDEAAKLLDRREIDNW